LEKCEKEKVFVHGRGEEMERQTATGSNCSIEIGGEEGGAGRVRKYGGKCVTKSETSKDDEGNNS
jgi:hypothetical protein